MADHFVGFSRGIQGLKAIDFTTGAASSAALHLEVRVFDSAGGAGMKRGEVINGLEAIIRFMENPQQTKAAGFVFLDG